MPGTRLCDQADGPKKHPDCKTEHVCVPIHVGGGADKSRARVCACVRAHECTQTRSLTHGIGINPVK